MEHRGGPHAATDGKVLVLRRLDQEEVFHLLELLRIRSGQVVRLAPIDIDVVELPLVGERRPFLDAFRHAAYPRIARARGGCEPAVVVDSHGWP